MKSENIFVNSDSAEDISYKDIIKNMVNIDFTEEEAALHYHYIMNHHDYLMNRLGRGVALSVAALDYFTFVSPMIKSPRVLEENEYWTMLVENSTDSLTGFYLRRYMWQKLNEEIHKGENHSYSFSVVFIDIDDFSEINNIYGHTVGDVVLKHITQMMKQSSRKRDVLFRYGGEEFVIIMPDTTRSEAFRFIERLRNRVEKKPVKIDGDIKVSATISSGIACYPYDGLSGQDLIEKADCAMYKAKGKGKNRVEIYKELR